MVLFNFEAWGRGVGLRFFVFRVRGVELVEILIMVTEAFYCGFCAESV